MPANAQRAGCAPLLNVNAGLSGRVHNVHGAPREVALNNIQRIITVAF